MAITGKKGFEVPYKSPVVETGRTLTNDWYNFFRNLYDKINHISTEESFRIANDQSSAANIEGLQFDFEKVNQAFVEYIVQRISRGFGAVERIEAGILMAVYKPNAETWHLSQYGTQGPDDAGITFSITNSGQIQYTTTDLDGVWESPSISKISFRTKVLAAKVVRPTLGWFF